MNEHKEQTAIDDSMPITLRDLKRYCESRCELYGKWLDKMIAFQMAYELTATSIIDSMAVMTKSFTNSNERFEKTISELHALKDLLAKHISDERRKEADFLHLNNGG